MIYIKAAFKEISFLLHDYRIGTGRRKLRMLHYWFAPSFCGILPYRLEQFAYLFTKGHWQWLRVFILPLLRLAQVYSNCQINHHASIDQRIKILHNSLGIVINCKAVIGSNLTLTDGNCVGGKKAFKQGEFIIGNNCNLGANAIIMGPLKLGHNVIIGAGAVVIRNFGNNFTLIGILAKQAKKITQLKHYR